MDEQLFVYGTLVEPGIQKKVIGRIVQGSQDILVGYERTTLKIIGTNYPDIAPNPGNFVNGQVIMVTGEELKLIDKYETDWYIRKRVLLKSGKSAWVYQGRTPGHPGQNIL